MTIATRCKSGMLAGYWFVGETVISFGRVDPVPLGWQVFFGGVRLDLAALMRRRWWPVLIDDERGLIGSVLLVPQPARAIEPMLAAVLRPDGHTAETIDARGTVWIRRPPAWPEHAR